jgi:hypothetical protein
MDGLLPPAAGASRGLRVTGQRAYDGEYDRQQNRISLPGVEARTGSMTSGNPKYAPSFIHGEPSWQHFAWLASIRLASFPGASSSNLVRQLLDRAGFADYRDRQCVLGGLVDRRFQIRGHLEQVGAFAGNLLLLRFVGGVRGGWFILLCGDGRGRTGNFFRRRSRGGWSRGRCGLRMTARQPCASRNGKCDATCQQAELNEIELHGAASNPGLRPPSTSASSALDRPHHGDLRCAGEPRQRSGHSCAQSSLERGVFICFFVSQM